MNIKKESFQELIEQEIFDGHSYGFVRLNLQYISESIVAEIGNGGQTPHRRQGVYPERPVTGQGNADQEREQETGNSSATLVKFPDLKKTHQKRVDKSANSSTQRFIDSSEIQRRVTPGRKERYFP